MTYSRGFEPLNRGQHGIMEYRCDVVEDAQNYVVSDCEASEEASKQTGETKDHDLIQSMRELKPW